jgi:hypothetical protein
MKGLFLATALAAIAVGASPVMAATFSGDYTASFNTSDPGLVLGLSGISCLDRA